MQIIETTDQRLFDDFLISQNASILQSWAWGEFQKKIGRKVWRLLLTNNLGRVRGAATVISMSLPRGKSYLYCPRGPITVPQSGHDALWRLFLDKLYDIVAATRPIFLRVDPQAEGYEKNFDLKAFGFEKIHWEIQPKDTVILDLAPGESDILHRRKPKTRYNINLARKKGIEVVGTTDASKVKIFWQLMAETSKRDRFSAHPYNYYFNLLQTLGKNEHAHLFLAYYKSRPLAAAFVSYFAQTATYLHGASSDRLRALMSPYLLQWSMIMEAKKRGMKNYDFGGIAPVGAEKHPWAGISRFKKGFGGKEISFMGAYDLAYDKLWYGIYKVARRLNRMV